MNKYKCKICGYIHEAKELEDDFSCPICGVDKTMFEEIMLLKLPNFMETMKPQI